MLIKKDSSSEWYVATWTIYICNSCGAEYYCMYKKNKDKCMSCVIKEGKL